MTTRNSFCRSCGEAILWARTAAGKAMPLNVDHEHGTVHLDADGTITRLTTTPEPGGHTPHFATCPNADQHRRPRTDHNREGLNAARAALKAARK